MTSRADAESRRATRAGALRRGLGGDARCANYQLQLATAHCQSSATIYSTSVDGQRAGRAGNSSRTGRANQSVSARGKSRGSGYRHGRAVQGQRTGRSTVHDQGRRGTATVGGKGQAASGQR